MAADTQRHSAQRLHVRVSVGTDYSSGQNPEQQNTDLVPRPGERAEPRVRPERPSVTVQRTQRVQRAAE